MRCTIGILNWAWLYTSHRWLFLSSFNAIEYHTVILMSSDMAILVLSRAFFTCLQLIFTSRESYLHVSTKQMAFRLMMQLSSSDDIVLSVIWTKLLRYSLSLLRIWTLYSLASTFETSWTVFRLHDLADDLIAVSGHSLFLQPSAFVPFFWPHCLHFIRPRRQNRGSWLNWSTHWKGILGGKSKVFLKP